MKGICYTESRHRFAAAVDDPLPALALPPPPLPPAPPLPPPLPDDGDGAAAGGSGGRPTAASPAAPASPADDADAVADAAAETDDADDPPGFAGLPVPMEEELTPMPPDTPIMPDMDAALPFGFTT